MRSAACKASDAAAGRCFGGLARLYQAVQDVRAKKDQNTLLLNAGDMYQVIHGQVMKVSAKPFKFDHTYNIGIHMYDEGCAEFTYWRWFEIRAF